MADTFEHLEISEVRYFPVIRAFAEKMNLVGTINRMVPSETDLSPGHYVSVFSIGEGEFAHR